MTRRTVALLFLLALAPAAHAASAPDEGTALEPRPASQPLYATKPPAEDEARQKHVVEAVDGIDLYVETWLPAPKDGNTPPERVPVVLIMTPYVQEDQERYPSRNLANVITWFTARGYAVAQHHVRGTGSSGGCLEQTAELQIDDGARIVEFLGRDAPYASGAVGMYGHSYDAETQVSTAGLGDPEKTKYLKAIVPSATVGGQYEYSFHDGVPYTGQALLSNVGYLALTSLAPGTAPVGPNTAERFGCVPEVFAASADQRGDFTEFWQVREYRPGAPNIKAATLWAHGLADWNVQPVALAGFFDRLPATTPHKGVFGQWEHNYPDKHAGVQPDWARQDWLAMVTAWYDEYLKGIDTGAADWPAVQLQDTSGRWHGEPGYPSIGGPAGHLALGPEGTLGATAPTGSTTFREGTDDSGDVPGTIAVFETSPFAAPLHISGQPVLDTWLKTSMPDAHVAVKLQVIGADDEPMVHAGSNDQELGTHGARSLQHLEGMPDNYFQQEQGQLASTGESLRVPIRMHPVDMLVPAGAKLRLTVSGSTAWARETEPSGMESEIELLHDCENTSALRFLVPSAGAPLLNVRETDEAAAGPLPSTPQTLPLEDGGGAAGAAVCGKAPERLDVFGPPAPPASLVRGGPGGGSSTKPGSPTTAAGAPAAPCADRSEPRARIARARGTRRRLSVSGTAADSGCAGVKRVRVTIARRSGKRCRFLNGRRFTRPRACRSTGGRARSARGATRWTLSVKARLPRGRYVVWVRAVDSAGNAGRATRRSLRRR